MVPLELYIPFLVAAVILIVIPGPNVGLIIANSLRHGVHAGLITVVAVSVATMIQLGVAVLGMTSLLAWAAQAFEWIRWGGAAYLIYLGIRQWRAPADASDTVPARASTWDCCVNGFVVSMTNPKTMLFYAAFLPQFVDPAGDVTLQMSQLALTFVVLAVVLDGAWALFASRFRGVLGRRPRFVNRLSGGILVGAGVGLALVRKGGV